MIMKRKITLDFECVYFDMFLCNICYNFMIFLEFKYLIVFIMFYDICKKCWGDKNIGDLRYLIIVMYYIYRKLI